MSVTSEALIAIGALITAFVAVYQARHSVRKDEMSRLESRCRDADQRIDHLEKENRALCEQVFQLTVYNIRLRTIMTEHGIDVPSFPLPTMDLAPESVASPCP